MAKVYSFIIIALVLCFSIAHAARPVAVFPDATRTKIHPETGVEPEGAAIEESCEGANEEDCLMRRTLSAHLDYIYTQNHGKKH